MSLWLGRSWLKMLAFPSLAVKALCSSAFPFLVPHYQYVYQYGTPQQNLVADSLAPLKSKDEASRVLNFCCEIGEETTWDDALALLSMRM